IDYDYPTPCLFRRNYSIMPRISLEMPHKLGREEVLRRIKDKFAEVHNQYGEMVNNFQENWVDHTHSFSFQAMGMAVSGSVQVEDSLVKLNADLPFAAMLFKGTIEQRIREEMDSLLS
ncbi:MAG: polyhydroxyalkanoic acid system family protein, partial [Thermoguttaceae bacterium]